MNRFWRLIDKSNECWTSSSPQFEYEGRYQRVHRVAWQIIHGPIPPNMHLNRTCDTDGCVNPDHRVLLSLSESAKLMHKRLKKRRRNKLW